MNWQTKEIFKQAKECLYDTGVFSDDQIFLLHKFTTLLEAAINKESSCIRAGINYSM